MLCYVDKNAESPDFRSEFMCTDTDLEKVLITPRFASKTSSLMRFIEDFYSIQKLVCKRFSSVLWLISFVLVILKYFIIFLV